MAIARRALRALVAAGSAGALALSVPTPAGAGSGTGVAPMLRLRTGDVSLALVLLVLSLPVHLAAMVALWLRRDGPVFYRQERVGRYGRPFSIVKLRTMRVDAEESGGPQWAHPDDPRITPLGRILRRTRLDELPQLVNILVGV